MPGAVDNQFTLSLTSRSGAKVDLTLANADERKALSALAAGFQAAVDGMASGDPQLRLSADRSRQQIRELHSARALLKEGGAR